MSEIKSTRHQKILNITFIGVFAALSYIVLAVLFIPFANMYIHFGNLVVVLAALLVGGWQGGLAGSVGMGLFDMLNGHIDSAPKTFLLKFLIGLTVGIVFSLLSSRKKFPSTALLISGIIDLLISASLLTYIIVHTGAYKGKSAILFPLFLVIGVLLITFSALKNKFSTKTASAIIAACAGMAVNLIGETLWKVVTYTLAGSNLSAAFISAALGQASTLINAGIAIIGGVALFKALEKPFNKILSK